MAAIIKLKDARRKQRKDIKNNDLTSYLKRAVLLRKEIGESRSGLQVTSLKKLRNRIESKIADILIKKEYVESDFFLCGNYISGLLTSIVNRIPKSWFAIDYILIGQESGNPHAIKQGADVCFLICTVFKERSELRAMRYGDYESMGIGLFHQFYNQTGMEIGYYMSRQYKTMVRVTDECMRTI